MMSIVFFGLLLALFLLLLAFVVQVLLLPLWRHDVKRRWGLNDDEKEKEKDDETI